MVIGEGEDPCGDEEPGAYVSQKEGAKRQRIEESIEDDGDDDEGLTGPYAFEDSPMPIVKGSVSGAG